MSADAAENLREMLRVAFVRGLDALDLSERVARAMTTLPQPPRRAKAVTVLAVGKAAGAMARGALSCWEGQIAHALVIEPDGTRRSMPDGPRVERLVAPHPDPDRRSVAAARRALDIVSSSDFTIALVSGGASSLICLPAPIPLSRYVKIVRALLLAGATVRDVNVVRRHLCTVKGGGLARAARGPLHTLVASDVIGGALHDVGSGPTVADPTTCAEARAVLRRFAPRLARPPMHESLKPTAPAAHGLRARFVARPEHLAQAVVDELRRRFPGARVVEPSVAPAEELAREYAARARRLRVRRSRRFASRQRDPGRAVARLIWRCCSPGTCRRTSPSSPARPMAWTVRAEPAAQLSTLPSWRTRRVKRWVAPWPRSIPAPCLSRSEWPCRSGPQGTISPTSTSWLEALRDRAKLRREPDR
jgi:glycerate 2-kinase